MEIILYIAAMVAAVAFLILCVSLSMTLFSVKRTLQTVSETMDGLTVQLEGVTTETTALLNKTNALAEDIQQKSQQLNTVVAAVKGVGDTVASMNTSVKRVTNAVSAEAERNSDKVAQVIQWGQVAFELMDKVKARQPSSKGWKEYTP